MRQVAIFNLTIMAMVVLEMIGYELRRKMVQEAATQILEPLQMEIYLECKCILAEVEMEIWITWLLSTNMLMVFQID